MASSRDSYGSQLANASHDRFFAGASAAMASTTVFGKRTLVAHGADTHHTVAAFKNQAVARLQAQCSPNLLGHSDLPFVRNSCLLLQGKPLFLSLAHVSLPFQ
jgi:hypothetical protein